MWMLVLLRNGCSLPARIKVRIRPRYKSTMTDNCYPDAAYRLLNQNTLMSWGYSIKRGATTNWERWYGYTSKSASNAVGIRFLKMEDACAVYEVGSGTYDFHAS